MNALFAFAAFVLVAVMVLSFGLVLDERRSHARLIRERLRDDNQPGQPAAVERLALLRDQMLSEIPAFDSLLRRSRRVFRLQSLLSQADLDIRAGNFLLASVLIAAATGIIIVVFSPDGWVIWPGALAALFLPYAYVMRRRARRFQRFEELFPEAIDMLVRSVRAGHAFVTALEMIANEVAEPISSEFRILYEEQKFGLPVRDALLNLAERIPLVDVKFFVTAVMLQRETGGNLAEILENLSYVIRERFKIQRQVRVYTAQGRMTMMLLMFLPPAVVVIMLFFNPSFIRPLFADPIGHMLILMGVSLQFIGFFVIRRIIRIRV
jgi:tight adherence protein B